MPDCLECGGECTYQRVHEEMAYDDDEMDTEFWEADANDNPVSSVRGGEEVQEWSYDPTVVDMDTEFWEADANSNPVSSGVDEDQGSGCKTCIPGLTKVAGDPGVDSYELKLDDNETVLINIPTSFQG